MKDKILRAIYDFYHKYGFTPSIRDIQKELHYQSHNSVYKVYKQLEQDGKLIHNKDRRRWNIVDINNNYLKLKVLNEDTYLTIDNDNENYFIYKMDNNNLLKDKILKNDYLVIKKTKMLKNYDLGLFMYNNEYHIMYYLFIDGFYMLFDNNSKEVLSKIKIIGKVVGLQRKTIIKKRCI
jgi:SOS-response transcriptional repressor LexA